MPTIPPKRGEYAINTESGNLDRLHRADILGLSVSLVRLISDTIGIGLGLAINYLIAFVFVWFAFGFPRFSRLPLKYYIFGLGSAIGTSLTFAISLSISSSGTQAMEVGMVNYLWPSLTIFFAVLFNGQKAKWWISIGVALAIYGICMVLSGCILVDFASMWDHVKTNPLAYFLALWAAIFWAAYSNFTRAWANGENPTTVIFGLNMLIFNSIWLLDLAPSREFSMKGLGIVILTAMVMGGAYGLWTFGVQKGKIAIMAIASYFTPVLSCVFASFLIGASLNHAFWAGVAVVVAGSFVCWAATRD